MYKVSQLKPDKRGRTGIIPVELILGSIHLFPRFDPSTPQDRTSYTVLEDSTTFFINPFANMRSYFLFST